MTIGQKINTLRKEKDMTLDDLSRKSGVAQATLSRIENDLTPGTLRTHMKICDALGVKLAEVYADLEDTGETVVPIGTETEEAEVFTYDERASSIILARQVARKNMLPQLLVLQQNGKTAIEQNAPGTERFIYCFEGEVEVVINEKMHQLKKGGTLYFKSSAPHYIKNTGTVTAKVLNISSPPAL